MQVTTSRLLATHDLLDVLYAMLILFQTDDIPSSVISVESCVGHRMTHCFMQAKLNLLPTRSEISS